MKYPKRVRMVEVGPRDGLQNEPGSVPAEVKVALIDRLSDAGLPVVEAGSFVSPKWVPQMADTAEVMARIRRKPGVAYPVLVPNMKGLEGALAAKAEEIAIFGAATEAFSKRNINCSIAESLERFEPVCRTALDHGMRVRGYMSVVLGCPYQGEVKPEAVAAVSQRLYDMGCYEISLGDTIGTGTPAKAQRMIETVAKKIPVEKLAGHFHDTYGQALANILAVMEMGVVTFDSSVAGLGGCPYAKGATGNVASEDVLYMLDGLGIETGVDMAKLLDAAEFICAQLKRPTVSRAGRALAAKREKAAA
jgi:hydroxymethylglutaryl-CoA lyase